MSEITAQKVAEMIREEMATRAEAVSSASGAGRFGSLTLMIDGIEFRVQVEEL